MSRPKRYRPPEAYARINLSQIAREIGRTQAQTRKLLARAERLGLLHPRIRGRKKAEITYDVVAVETLKAMIGVPDRPAPAPDTDWLSTYLGEAPHARQPPREPRDPGPA